MARFTHSFKTLSKGFHQDSRNSSGVQYATSDDVSYYETGRITIHRWFNRHPERRGFQKDIGGVQVTLAKDVDTPTLYTPDNIKVPKSWLFDNPVLWTDFDHGVVLNANDRIYYNGPDAIPYSERCIRVHKPNKPKADQTFEKVKEIMLHDRASAKLGQPLKAPPSSYVYPIDKSNFFADPSEKTYTPQIAFFYQRSSDADLYALVKEHCFDVLLFPYLQTHCSTNGRIEK